MSLTDRILCTCNGAIDLLKHVSPHMCYHAKFGRSALKGVSINTGEPPNSGERWNSALFGWKAWLTPPQMCYHITFGSSATKGVRNRINRRNLQNWGALGPRPLGVGARLTQ